MLEGIKKIHLIGIGGFWMRALSQNFILKRNEVSGSGI